MDFLHKIQLNIKKNTFVLFGNSYFNFLKLRKLALEAIRTDVSVVVVKYII